MALAPAAQREYQRAWMADRRRAWLDGKVCAACGSPDDLEVDHVDPETKVAHAVWSWSSERREAELAKCQVLCEACHQVKTTRETLARRAAQTHCKRSHPFSGDNLIIQRGNRLCRECRRLRRLRLVAAQ
jgi:5-methylcytosine-specific restriction endonuclease McrA